MRVHAYKKINKKERESIDIDFQVKGSYKVVGFVTYTEYGQMINAYILKVANGFDLALATGSLKGCCIGKWYPSYLENAEQDLNTNDPIPWGPSK